MRSGGPTCPAAKQHPHHQPPHGNGLEPLEPSDARLDGAAELGQAGTAAAADEPHLRVVPRCRRADEAEASEDGEDDDDDDDEYMTTPDDAPRQIEEALYIGSFLSEQNQCALKGASITHILQVAEGMQPSHPDEFLYTTIHVQDTPSEDLVAHFAKCFAFIDDAAASGGAALVHCVAGISRSASVCIGYLMWKHRIPYDDAFRRVHRARPWVMPNEGFRRQLAEFERLEYDLSKWRAWRHTWREDPLNDDPISLIFSTSPPQGSRRG